MGRALVCPSCGYKYADFRQAGLLGCPECYAAFEAQLSPLLSRAHEGGTHHVGKVPWGAGGAGSGGGGGVGQGSAETLDPTLRTRPGGVSSMSPGGAGGCGGGGGESSVERAKREAKIVALRQQLAEVVRGERYEEAAALRDEIARLQSIGTAKAVPLAKKVPFPPGTSSGAEPGRGAS